MPPQYPYKKRAFLGDVQDSENGYIAAIVESSDQGTYPLGNYILTFADCRRSIELEFSLASPTLMRQSLKRINVIADMVIGFRRALKTQARLIKNCRDEQVNKKKGPTEEEIAKNKLTKLRRRRGGRR